MQDEMSGVSLLANGHYQPEAGHLEGNLCGNTCLFKTAWWGRAGCAVFNRRRSSVFLTFSSAQATVRKEKMIIRRFREIVLVCLALNMFGLTTAMAKSGTDSQWHMHTGGLSHHFVSTGASNREWNQNHPGVGLEYRPRPQADWGGRWTMGVMRDSRNVPGGYAGAAYVRQFNRNGDFNASIGLGAYLFYRSESWDGRMTVVPAILPTVSFGLFKNRVGVNLLAIPKVKLAGKQSTPLLFAQFTIRYN